MTLNPSVNLITIDAARDDHYRRAAADPARLARAGMGA